MSQPPGTVQAAIPAARATTGGMMRLARWLLLPVLLGSGLTATWLGFSRFGLVPLLAGVMSVAKVRVAPPFRRPLPPRATRVA